MIQHVSSVGGGSCFFCGSYDGQECRTRRALFCLAGGLPETYTTPQLCQALKEGRLTFFQAEKLYQDGPEVAFSDKYRQWGNALRGLTLPLPGLHVVMSDQNLHTLAMAYTEKYGKHRLLVVTVEPSTDVPNHAVPTSYKHFEHLTALEEPLLGNTYSMVFLVNPSGSVAGWAATARKHNIPFIAFLPLGQFLLDEYDAHCRSRTHVLPDGTETKVEIPLKG